ncbi:MAG: glycosyltransferase [Paraprevotella sp.]|jgi:glycosyltransferase involved in cell wall biosynthesis|uniref:glycosyltransferase family 2 protein n=1 Tax=Paraprevotella sp. TaxID=2049036 RepID=UPI00257D2ECB|nr:glycosyltransferase family 2 protein [Paraprevotella sp.]MBS4807478.1 glycosyltransferase [Paraprevotella sp.]
MTELLYKSELFHNSQSYALTFFTSTFNRKDTIGRTYESLLNVICPAYNGNIVTFEWIIVDDGSTDGTIELGKKWCEENKLPIRYFRQENQGKHVAMNFVIQQARGKYWLTIDSDDSILPNALEIFFKTWEEIKDDGSFCAVAARCKDESGKIVGNLLPHSPLDVNAIDLRLKYRIKGEMLEMYKIDVLKQYRFPTYDPRMRFCPENIVWFEMARKYKMRVIDEAVRVYYHDAVNSLMVVKNVRRSVSNYYMWLYYLNNLSRYVIYNPIFILKAYVGVSMDGFLSGKKASSILYSCDSIIKKLFVFCLMPLGYILNKINIK